MKPKPVLLYILFFAAACIAFLFVLFPQKQAAVYLSRSLTGLTAHIRVSMDNAKPVFPLGLKFENVKLFLDQDIQVEPDFFKVSWGLPALFQKEKQVKFQSAIGQGSVTGSLGLNSTDPLVFSNADFSFSQIKINQFMYKTKLADLVLDCEITGQYRQIKSRLDGDNKNRDNLDENKTDGQDMGQGQIMIQQFSSVLKDSFFNTLNLPRVDFSQIELEFTHNSKIFKVTRCSARGSIINLNLNGTIEMVFPLQESRLHLTGTLLPDSPYLAKFANTAVIRSIAKNISKDGVRFNINGTLKDPEIGL